MKYSETFTLTSHDADSFSRVRPSVVLRLMQETANHAMRDEGESYNHLFERGLSFVLAEIHVRQFITLRQYDRVSVSTWASSDSHGASFNRCYCIDLDGESAARASSVWAVVDTRDGGKRLLRFGEENFTYSVDEPLDGFPHFRIPRAASFEPAGEFTVTYRDADLNRHMNNTNYPDILCGFIPDISDGALRVEAFDIRFLHEAPLGERVNVTRAATDGGYLFRTVRESDGEVNVEAGIILR